jgi:drug/metabolite transporter (DMT)-like permease
MPGNKESSLLISGHVRAVLQAVLVTVLWSSSWVLIKEGLNDIPPLTFAGLRYVLAAAFLIPIAMHRSGLAAVRQITQHDWGYLAIFGIVQYTLTQGAQFLSLAYLPATTASLLLAFTPALVALLGIVILQEQLSRIQWAGVILFLAGAFLYFGPVRLSDGEQYGLLIGTLGVLANAAQQLLGRHINRDQMLSALLVTAISMTFGSVILLAAGIASEGFPTIALKSWAIIIWLAVINTAFGFWLWNHTQRSLLAVESSVINNTMLIQIALLAWVYLGERPTLVQLTGIGLAFLGALVVQIVGAQNARRRSKSGRSL